MTSNDLRYGLGQAVMPTATLSAILTSHQRNPCYPVYLYRWRHGPSGKITVYDMHLPVRTGISPDACTGWAASDWWIYATSLNVSDVMMGPYDGSYVENICERAGCKWSLVEVYPREFCPKCACPISIVVKSPGYKNVLVRLLREGSIKPSQAITEWLGDESRKFVPNDMRLFYLRN